MHWSTISLATLPSTQLRIPPCPLCPMMIRSASDAASLITWAALPSLISAVTLRSG